MNQPDNLEENQIKQVHGLLLGWYARQGRDLPWRTTSDPYSILVSEIMLQQTQVDRVLPKYREFLERFPTLAQLAEAATAEVIRAWAPLGYNMRAVRLQAIARQVLAEYDGKIPADEAELLKLKGVGRYTAGALACFAYRRQVPTVDTNIRRVLQRMFVGIEREAAPLSEQHSWELARQVLPPDRAYEWNQALMDLGATICTATTPACEVCPLQQVCAAYKELGEHALFPSGKDLRLLVQQQKQRPAKSGRQQPTATASEAQEALARPAVPGPLTKVAEATSAYKTVPFTSTNRYFRGRVVDALRALAPGERLSLPELGPQVKADFSAAEDMAWLSRLTEELARDGLIALHHASGEPAGKLQPAESLLLVSLP
ncbi:MAG TPA: A/G-specific adenine glycosylase [Ktedonobacterales bacterium]|jgi:A/G-specific adenine glycosylase